MMRWYQHAAYGTLETAKKGTTRGILSVLPLGSRAQHIEQQNAEFPGECTWLFYIIGLYRSD